MKAIRSRRARIASAVALVACVAVGQSAAAEEPSKGLRDSKLFRFEFDNDTFLDSDDGFSAGWSLQIHSRLLDEWTPGLAGWIGRIPTLGDDGKGGRIARWSWGITQLIITPADVTIAEPQPEDSPWAGLLGGYVSWSSYDNHRLAALQAYLGCIGPCSHAEQVQKFVHNDLNFGNPPVGWPNQIDNDVLVNLNYEYRHKLWMGGAKYETTRWGRDLSVGTQVGVGSFATYGEVWLEYRFGWDIPPGFTKLADPPALGIALDPVYLDPSKPRADMRSWRPYFNVVARVRSVNKFAPLEGGATQNGGVYQQVVSTPGENQLILGAHFARLPLAFHFTYYRYLDDEAVTGRIRSQLDWVNLSFERRF